jgi:HPt (histidine-containing phosphotransfer) domain-containing protein
MEPPYGEIPIVALTANATKSDVDKCLSIGMSDYLPKPFTPEDLYNKLFDDLKIRPTKRDFKTEEEVKKPSYDLNYLREVSGDNKEFIQEMVQTFVTTIPKVLTEMRESLKVKDWDKVSSLAHQIKPSLTLMGLSEMKNDVVVIEQNCKSKTKLGEMPDLVYDFSYQCESAITELKKELD